MPKYLVIATIPLEIEMKEEPEDEALLGVRVDLLLEEYGIRGAVIQSVERLPDLMH